MADPQDKLVVAPGQKLGTTLPVERAADKAPPGMPVPTVPPAKAEPHPYVIKAQQSREYCGCSSCLGTVRKTTTGHVNAHGGGAPVTCMAQSIFARLTEPGAK